MSENSALNSLVRLGKQSMRRTSSAWYCSGGNRYVSNLANRLGKSEIPALGFSVRAGMGVGWASSFFQGGNRNKRRR